MKLNKISHIRFKEENERGFDILTNDPLRGPEASKSQFEAPIQKPRGVWTSAMRSTNKGMHVKNLNIFHNYFSL